MIKKADWTNLDRNDTVVVYPTIGHLTEDGLSWRIDIYGTVYESGQVSRRKQLLLRFLQKVVKVRPSDGERMVFDRRIKPFIAPTEKGKRVALRVGNKLYCLKKKTRRNGRFAATVRLTAEEVHRLEDDGHLENGWVPLRFVTRHRDNEPYAGRVRLLTRSGVSVISDIDDTMKLTEVHCRRSLISNTFLREFQSISGMSDHYRGWCSEGADFHYVSSSPWQLFEPLAEHFAAAGFPEGTFHLRSFKFREHMMRKLFLLRRRGKLRVIRQIVKRFPKRRFVLVGDSGEKDPEIYGVIARKYPDQVQSVFIRNLKHARMDQERMQRAFRDVPVSRWQVFESPDELPGSLG